MKVFVAGATGKTGRKIVAELVKKNIPVCALVRDKAKAQELLPPEVQIVVGDVLQPETYSSAVKDCDTVVCATGATPELNPTVFYQVDYEGSKKLIDVAKEAQIKRFIFVTSLCVSRFFHPLNLFGLVLFWKKQAEKYLIASGLDYTIVRPAGLKNEDNNYPVVVEGADTLFEGSIPRQKVAEVCVESLFYPETNNRILEIVAQAEAKSMDWQELFSY